MKIELDLPDALCHQIEQLIKTGGLGTILSHLLEASLLEAAGRNITISIKNEIVEGLKPRWSTLAGNMDIDNYSGLHLLLTHLAGPAAIRGLS